jgi:hypothetical protein
MSAKKSAARIAREEGQIEDVAVADAVVDAVADVGASGASVSIARQFEVRLAEIEQDWLEAGDAQAFDGLLELLRDQVIPLLKSEPRTGARLLDHEPDATESTHAGAALLEIIRSGSFSGCELRVLTFSGYRLLYLEAGETVYLLSLRHNPASADE